MAMRSYIPANIFSLVCKYVNQLLSLLSKLPFTETVKGMDNR